MAAYADIVAIEAVGGTPDKRSEVEEQLNTRLWSEANDEPPIPPARDEYDQSFFVQRLATELHRAVGEIRLVDVDDSDEEFAELERQHQLARERSLATLSELAPNVEVEAALSKEYMLDGQMDRRRGQLVAAQSIAIAQQANELPNEICIVQGAVHTDTQISLAHQGFQTDRVFVTQPGEHELELVHYSPGLQASREVAIGLREHPKPETIRKVHVDQLYTRTGWHERYANFDIANHLSEREINHLLSEIDVIKQEDAVSKFDKRSQIKTILDRYADAVMERELNH
ncbi:MAG TPA: hypothetical protein VI322_00500 [Candidatus Saccharimonadia bacterium]